MSKVRYDHVTMFILCLPLAVFSFSVKSSSFVLASKARISLHYSHVCTLYFKKTETQISRLPFVVNAINLSIHGIMARGKKKGGGEGGLKEGFGKMCVTLAKSWLRPCHIAPIV